MSGYQASGSATSAPAMRPHAGTGRFDPTTGLYIPLNTVPFRQWRKAVAKAKAGTRTAKLLASGDSITFGQYATPNAFTDGWVARLRNKIDAALGVSAGSGVVWCWDTFAGQAWRNDDTRLTVTGATEQAGYGPFALSALRLTPGQTIAFAPTKQCDGFRVYFIKQVTNYNITASIDGGAAANYSAGGGTQNSVGTVDIPAGAMGVHSITLGAASNGVYIVGVESTVSGGMGIAVTGCGAPGKQCSAYNAASTDGDASWRFLTDGVAPDLTILGFGHNEYLGQVSIDAQTSALTTAIQRAQTGGSDVLLMTTVPNSDLTKTPTQDAVNQIRYSLADSLGVPVLDLYNWWGSYAADTALYANGTHPANPGYESMADIVFGALGI